ncbi:unnamed protein product [Brachionus calyciflorus]|uniref:Protein kinase domain-containing protein n=1 Tax=Brachionus calyciflorus TaxID=104777 RepID=A0A814FH68_9BILA|nr:unnamed protein product [Brachionus calyciflorus]
MTLKKSFSDSNLACDTSVDFETKISRFKLGNSSMRVKGEVNFNINFLNSTDRRYNFKDAKLEIINIDSDGIDNEVPPPYSSISEHSEEPSKLKKCSSDTDLKSIKLSDVKFKVEKKHTKSQVEIPRKNSKKYANQNLSTRTIFEGLFGCIRPIASLWSTKSSKNVNRGDYNIPFEELKDLVFLGSGAQGCVFKAMLNKEEVAVKKVKSKEEADTRHLRKLNHVNLVKFKAVSINSDKFFCIIMEYCPNGQLFTYLKSQNLLQPSVMVDMAKQIANGMNYLHNNKIIHRDLKSPNILLSDNNVLKISDFGACKNMSDTVISMSFKGTIAWTAPEIFRGELCSEKVDVYSFGVVLWELLTCETPYKNIDPSSIMYAVASNRLRLPIPNSAPDGIKLLLAQCFMQAKNRPGFNHIIKHLDILSKSDELIQFDQEFAEKKIKWKEELQSHPMFMSTKKLKLYEADEVNCNCRYRQMEEDFKRKRDEELRNLYEITEFYDKKIENLKNMHFELTNVMLELQEREKNLIKKEKQANIRPKKPIVESLMRKQFSNDKKLIHQIEHEKPQTLPEAAAETITQKINVQILNQAPVLNQEIPQIKLHSPKKTFHYYQIKIDFNRKMNYLNYKRKSRNFKINSNFKLSLIRKQNVKSNQFPRPQEIKDFLNRPSKTPLNNVIHTIFKNDKNFEELYRLRSN